MPRKKKDSYSLKEENGNFTIMINESKPLKTPHGTIFQTPHQGIAEQVLEDLVGLGKDSYKTPYSSLCFAFTYDNIITNDWVNAIRDELSNAHYEIDEAFQPGSIGLPPARVLWNHIYVEPDRADKVREWIMTLNPQQLSAVLTVYQSTQNMNLAYVFGHLIIDEGDEGYLIDLENLYGNPWANFGPNDEDIDRIFEIFKVFYTAENED